MSVTREMKEEQWESIFELQFLEAEPGNTTALQGRIMNALEKLKTSGSLKYMDLIVLENIVTDAFEHGRLSASEDKNLPIDATIYLINPSLREGTDAWIDEMDVHSVDMNKSIVDSIGELPLAQDQNGRKLVLEFEGPNENPSVVFRVSGGGGPGRTEYTLNAAVQAFIK